MMRGVCDLVEGAGAEEEQRDEDQQGQRDGARTVHPAGGVHAYDGIDGDDSDDGIDGDDADDSIGGL